MLETSLMGVKLPTAFLLIGAFQAGDWQTFPMSKGQANRARTSHTT